MKNLIMPILLQDAREYAAEIHIRLSKNCLEPGFGFAPHITHEDKVKYSEYQRKIADDIISGKLDHNFTVWQRMNYYITGKCVPLLSK